MPYKEMECPACGYLWKGNVPEPRDKCFYEVCHGCGAVVLFKDVTSIEQKDVDNEL